MIKWIIKKLDALLWFFEKLDHKDKNKSYLTSMINFNKWYKIRQETPYDHEAAIKVFENSGHSDLADAVRNLKRLQDERMKNGEK